ncbi:uncharacterized protein LOC133799923 [Humulus lupulus]|uniref:uncharacterized protein LOC133799923 n=1 Tax=Humulus lupulus TaxID=3486 RepID=UPI002B406D23|nr:uncharacterized protein LOC133799923 [Humulus lupulus]
MATTENLVYKEKHARIRVEDNLEEAKGAQKKAEEALKPLQDKLDSAEAMVNDLKAELDTKTADFDAARAEIDRMKIETTTSKAEIEHLREEKNSAFKILEDKKKCMLEEFKGKKDWATDRAMYMMWSLNPDIDTLFLQDKEEEFISKLKARLAEEEVTDTTQDGGNGDEKGEEVESSSANQ